MSYVLTVNNLATSYADKLGGDQVRKERLAHNFKITAFNASSVALIVTAALAIFTNSPLFLLLAGVTYCTRNAFMKSIDATPVDGARTLFQFLDFRVLMKGVDEPAVPIQRGVPPAPAVPVAVVPPAAPAVPRAPEAEVVVVRRRRQEPRPDAPAVPVARGAERPPAGGAALAVVEEEWQQLPPAGEQ